MSLWLLPSREYRRERELRRRLMVRLQPKAMPAPRTGKGAGTGTVFKVMPVQPSPSAGEFSR